MALTAQQLCSLACSAAGAPNYLPQAGLLLNTILDELAQTYDLDVARGTFNFNFNPSLVVSAPTEFPNLVNGGGPYPLPADYLRANPGGVVWFLQGVAYPMIPLDLYQFDTAVQQAGLQNYPSYFATDLSLSPPGLVVYPPPSGAYPCMVRYQRQMPDIVTPQTSATVPWFPNSQYLRTRLTGELMAITGDERAVAYLGESPVGAQGILRRYLNMANDNENRPKSVTLDRRVFRTSGGSLPNTKLTGW